MPRALRLVPLGIAVVITQVSVLPQLRMLGVVPDLGLVAALAVAWFDGPEAGRVVRVRRRTAHSICSLPHP